MQWHRVARGIEARHDLRTTRRVRGQLRAFLFGKAAGAMREACARVVALQSPGSLAPSPLPSLPLFSLHVYVCVCVCVYVCVCT